MALELMRKYAEQPAAFYPEQETVPIEGAIKPGQIDLIRQGQRINRIDYELCVLPVLRENLRCKEIYAQGASRYRDPDADIPCGQTRGILCRSGAAALRRRVYRDPAKGNESGAHHAG
jgi:hypothetical protein